MARSYNTKLPLRKDFFTTSHIQIIERRKRNTTEQTGRISNKNSKSKEKVQKDKLLNEAESEPKTEIQNWVKADQECDLSMNSNIKVDHNSNDSMPVAPKAMEIKKFTHSQDHDEVEANQDEKQDIEE